MSGMKVAGYHSSWEFILKRCEGRSVLHLGCVGETDGSSLEKLEAFAANRVLHTHLTAVAREVVGIDLDAAAVELLRSKLKVENIVRGDAEHLEDLALGKTFDVVVCGGLIEHLSCPGLILEGLSTLMGLRSELIISTPNTFALMANLRFTLGRFRDGNQHVANYSKHNLDTLLTRHQFQVTELYTAFARPPASYKERFKFSLGIPFFKLFPERGGTLLLIAKKCAAAQ